MTQRCPGFACRCQVWKIEDFLTKWEGSCSGAAANDPGKAAIALVLLQEIDTYRCDSLLFGQQPIAIARLACIPVVYLPSSCMFCSAAGRLP
jgi:hypothetical protein